MKSVHFNLMRFRTSFAPVFYIIYVYIEKMTNGNLSTKLKSINLRIQFSTKHECGMKMCVVFSKKGWKEFVVVQIYMWGKSKKKGGGYPDCQYEFRFTKYRKIDRQQIIVEEQVYFPPISHIFFFIIFISCPMKKSNCVFRVCKQLRQLVGLIKILFRRALQSKLYRPYHSITIIF